jgi:sporulation protein YlmC with PRC-barrel domain
MLITHVKPTELWGKKIYDTDGNFLGRVVAIASRRGVVHKVVAQRVPRHRRLTLVLPADARIDADNVVVPMPLSAVQPQLRVVR